MKKKLRVDVLSIFPEMFPGYFEASILGRAQKAKLLDVKLHQLRDWAYDRHHRVDDKPYGGGPGMLIKIEPFHEALVDLKMYTKAGKRVSGAKKSRIILTSAKGSLFTQRDAERLSKYDRLIFLCGRYEGVDERVAEHFVDEELSIGPYVLTGGEVATMVMVDAIARLRPGVLGKEESLANESWNVVTAHESSLLEYPQYTRPEDYRGWKVPPELLSGNHAEIEKWRTSKRKRVLKNRQ